MIKTLTRSYTDTYSDQTYHIRISVNLEKHSIVISGYSSFNDGEESDIIKYSASGLSFYGFHEIVELAAKSLSSEVESYWVQFIETLISKIDPSDYSHMQLENYCRSKLEMELKLPEHKTTLCGFETTIPVIEKCDNGAHVLCREEIIEDTTQPRYVVLCWYPNTREYVTWIAQRSSKTGLLFCDGGRYSNSINLQGKKLSFDEPYEGYIERCREWNTAIRQQATEDSKKAILALPRS